MSGYTGIRIIPSTDGSHTLEVPSMNETYHSVHGAWTESMHVYIRMGLDQFPDEQACRILEIGFGTGLNAFLTLINQGRREIVYDTVELHPLESDIFSALNYPRDEVEKELFLSLHRAPWEKPVSIRDNFYLRKLRSDIHTVELQSDHYDLVYYDAFAPSRQPEMWELPVLERVVRTMKTHAILVTYCAQGQFKRDLKALGLEVLSLEGPPGKHEMVRAVKRG